MGFALLAALSLVAALAALAVTARARLRGRAEEVVAATLIGNAIVVVPIYALGLTGHLTAAALAVASLVTSAATFGAASAGVGAGPLLRRTAGVARGLLRLPIDALALSWRARSLVFVGVAFAALLLPYLAVTSYLAQQMPHWDPLWYHDTMVGFAIQNHSLAMVDVPPTLQKVNGYVRLGEMTQLWLVIFADRRLADLTNLLFAPAIAAAVYVLARRWAPAAPRHTAVGWGVAVVLMPACSNLLQSTYVDPQNAALLLGGIVFATLDSPRLRDGWLAGLGLALAIGSKGLSLVPVPVAGLIAAAGLLRAHRGARRSAALATIAGGLLLIVGTASLTYLRNYWAFHNPLWPDMSVELPKLGIHWPGQGPWVSEPGRPGQPVNVNEPLPKLFDHLLALPWSVKGMYFDQAVDYGIGVSWIAVPLGIIAFAACLVAALRRARRRGVAQPAAVEEARPPLGVALILAAIVAGSPALWGPRYHIAAVGLLVTLCAWFTARPSRERIGEAAVSAVVVTSLMMFWWTPAPRWWFTPEQLRALGRASPTVREVDQALGAPTPLATGLAREKELGPGKVLVFNERYSGFPSLFWNNHFSNRVVYMHGGADFLARAAKAGATWVFLNDHDPLVAAARHADSGWQEVGVLNLINGGFAFRKVAVRPPAPPPAAPPSKKPPQPAAPAAPTAPILWRRR